MLLEYFEIWLNKKGAVVFQKNISLLFLKQILGQDNE